MYITDARHFLDDKGAIAPLRGPAKAMADFHAGVIAYATDFDGAVDLAGVMAESEQVHRCYVGHLAGYLHGAPVSALDEGMLDTLTEASLGGASIHALILEIVADPSFRVVRVE